MLKKDLSSRGFTLIELIVVVIILSVLMVLSFALIDPISQLDKAKDAQRKHDFEQIKSSLDTYYNDHDCYPTQQQNVSFGREWNDSANGTVYMKVVPQDPDCFKTGYCYVYQTDTNSCPQWNVLYARLSRPTNSKTSCVIQACGVGNVKYNYCVTSGNIDCSYIKVNPLPPPGIPSSSFTPAPTPIPTIAPTPVPTPTPTPPPSVPCSSYYAFTGTGPTGLPLCNNLGNDPQNKCTVHGGTFICYSINDCTGIVCQ